MAPISPGMRVVRGPDWSWEDQDGGEGFVGTIVNDSNKSLSHPEGTVLVRWDHGKQSNYRVGHNSTYDLRLVDNGPIGIKHMDKSCKNCGDEFKWITGVLWSCTTCPDVFLCTQHYMSDKHDLHHQFLRLEDRYILLRIFLLTH